jgi:Na+/phosphate symporter
MMIKISGSADAKDGGEMTIEITNDNNVKNYIDLFPFYKTLSKLCHWSMNAHKDNYAEVKVKNLTQAIIDKDNNKVKNEKVILALDFSAQIEEQIKLLTEQEKPQIDAKKEKIQKAKKEIQ